MVHEVNYAFAMNDTMELFWHRLKPGTPFLWSPILQEKFVLAKEMIVKAVTDGVRHILEQLLFLFLSFFQLSILQSRSTKNYMK